MCVGLSFGEEDGWERGGREETRRDAEETRKRQVDRWGERREERGRCREKRCAHLI